MLTRSTYIGRYLGGYRINVELASNTFCHVFLGESVAQTKQFVAIKRLHVLSLASQSEQEAFLQEARTFKQLRHPFILPVLVADVDRVTPYIITEYAPLGSLRDVILRKATSSPDGLALFTNDEALFIISQVGQALEYAHAQKIVHGNLKPHNILFNAQGQVQLNDFTFTSLLELLNSPSVDLSYRAEAAVYQAPEQTPLQISAGADLYALGCIAYELFTGRQPFSNPSTQTLALRYKTQTLAQPSYLNPELPQHIEQAILKAMDKNPEERYPSVAAFLSALGLSSASPAPVRTLDPPTLVPPVSPEWLGAQTPQDAPAEGDAPTPKRLNAVTAPTPGAAPTVTEAYTSPFEALLASSSSNSGSLSLQEILATPQNQAIPSTPASFPFENSPILQPAPQEPFAAQAEVSPAFQQFLAEGSVAPATLEEASPAIAQVPFPSAEDLDQEPTQVFQPFDFTPTSSSGPLPLVPPPSLPISGPHQFHQNAFAPLPPGIDYQALRRPPNRNVALKIRLPLIIVACILLLFILIAAPFALFPSSTPRQALTTSPSASATTGQTANVQNQATNAPTPVPTPADSPIPIYPPTPTPVPTQPLPTATPNPTTTSTPNPTATPTVVVASTFTASPASLGPNNCTLMGNFYACNVRLSLQGGTKSQIWYLASSSVNSRVSPAFGVLAPGRSTRVSISITASCPGSGTLVFMLQKSKAPVRWSC